MGDTPWRRSGCDDARAQQPISFSVWALAVVGVLFGACVWYIRLGIPAVPPAFGGPDPARVLMFIAVATLGCLAFSVAVFSMAIRMRSLGLGFCALVPFSFVLTLAAQLLLGAV